MKKLSKILILIAATVAVTLMSTSCFRQNYMLFEDGDFDGIEFSDYDLMQNAELDMDDADRDWRSSWQHLFAFLLKNIKRRDVLSMSILSH